MSVLPLDPTLAQRQHALQSDYDATTPDAHVIARQIVYQRNKRQQKSPKTTDLAFSITSISHDHTTGAAGAPTLTLNMQDPGWTLLDSGFFDTDDQGRLLDIDVNYPDRSRFWWRLHQISPQQDRSIQLVFVPRVAAELMGLFGPIKVNRAKRTRAQFLQMLCAKVKDAQGAIEFYSHELDVKQKIGNSGPSASTQSSAKITAKGKAAKHVGLGANTKGLTCKGRALTSVQAQNANVILQVGDQLKAPHNALVAAIYAAMGETSLGADPNTYGGTGGSQGVFQTMPGHYSGGRDLAAQAHGWFTGGQDFQAGGGIKCAVRGDPPWKIANEVEANAVYNTTGGDSYQSYFPGGQSAGIGEAAAIVAGGGGASGGAGSGGGTIDVAQPYYFMINAGEDYWTGMNRLAQEVAWELIVDGNRIYYDSDTELIRQKVAAVIDRDDETTFAWNYDWENRHIATNVQVQLACTPFQFCSGEVVQLTHFGAASTGSTAKLPGRWLINQISHNSGDVFSSLSLVQPTPPKAEPAPQMTTQNVKAPGAISMGGSIQSKTPGTAEAAFVAAQYLASLKLIYTQQNRTLVRDVGKQAGKACYDCSASVSWVLLAAGFPLPGQVGWNGWAPVSGDYFANGAGGALKAGPGKNMTIYANSEHVFIRIHPDGYADMQGNTVSPLVHERGFDFFPWDTSGCGGWGGPSPGVGAPAFNQVHYEGT
jgi:hypothetical protein